MILVWLHDLLRMTSFWYSHLLCNIAIESKTVVNQKCLSFPAVVFIKIVLSKDRLSGFFMHIPWSIGTCYKSTPNSKTGHGDTVIHFISTYSEIVANLRQQYDKFGISLCVLSVRTFHLRNYWTDLHKFGTELYTISCWAHSRLVRIGLIILNAELT